MKKFGIFIMAACLMLQPAAVSADEPENVSEAETITAIASGGQSSTVRYHRESTFIVTVPKTIMLDSDTKSASYTVSVQGDIMGDTKLIVKPDDAVTLRDAKGKSDVTGTVTQDRTEFVWRDIIDMVTAAGTVKAAGLSAGDWTGSLMFSISLSGE